MRELFLQNSQIQIFQLFKNECHLLSDKLESMEIFLRVNDTMSPKIFIS